MDACTELCPFVMNKQKNSIHQRYEMVKNGLRKSNQAEMLWKAVNCNDCHKMEIKLLFYDFRFLY